MGRLQWSVELAGLLPFCHSRLARHVARLEVDGEGLDVDALSVLAQRMPHVTGLHCDLRLSEQPAPLPFPPRLQQLRVYLCPFNAESATTDVDYVSAVNAAIASVGRLPELHTLKLYPPSFDPRISFAPLVALPKLQELWIRSEDWSRELSPSQVEELRRMPRLEKVNLRVSTERLARVLQQPHDLQWQALNAGGVHDDAFVSLLPQLPSLTHIRTYRWRCTSFDFLLSLPRLQLLHVDFEEAPVAPEQLVPVLRSCSQLTDLSLANQKHLTSAHLADSLAGLPRLRHLCLFKMPALASLSFLASPPLAHSLEVLTLSDCRSICPSELHRLHSLHSLTSLHLHWSLSGPLDAYTQRCFTPPTALLPALAHFNYMQPIPNEDEDEEEDDEE